MPLTNERAAIRGRRSSYRLEIVAALSIAAFCGGIVWLIARSFSWEAVTGELQKPTTLPMLVIFLSMIGLSGVALALDNRYSLRRRRRDRSGRSIIGTLFGVDEPAQMQSEHVSKLQEELSNLRILRSDTPVALSDEVQKEILNHYRSALESHLGPNLQQQVRLLVDQTFKREVEFQAAKFLDEVNQRLKSASSTVSARGFLNLILGIAFAGGALMVLQQAVSFLSPESLARVPTSTVVYVMGTRVSIALVITLVAYFFLSLYRKSLEDAKFYQNEMTDMNSKAAALHLSYYEGDKALKAHVLTTLVESNRNHRPPRPAVAGDVKVGTSENTGPWVRVVEKLVDKIPSLRAEG